VRKSQPSIAKKTTWRALQQSFAASSKRDVTSNQIQAENALEGTREQDDGWKRNAVEDIEIDSVSD
jgi:hypothetical protein